MQHSSCSCFSLCTSASVAAFFDVIPATPPDDSPWHGYLREVYGQRGPPPRLMLHQLGFFYHRHKGWPQDVEWPMAPCSAAAWSKSCDPDVCSRWFRPAADHKAALARQRNYSSVCGRSGTFCYTVKFSYRGKETTGTLIEGLSAGRQRVALYRQVDRANNASAGKDFLDGGPPARVDARLMAAWRGDGEGSMTMPGREQIVPTDHRWVEVLRVNDYAYGFAHRHVQVGPAVPVVASFHGPIAHSPNSHRPTVPSPHCPSPTALHTGTRAERGTRRLRLLVLLRLRHGRLPQRRAHASWFERGATLLDGSTQSTWRPEPSEGVGLA